MRQIRNSDILFLLLCSVFLCLMVACSASQVEQKEIDSLRPDESFTDTLIDIADPTTPDDLTDSTEADLPDQTDPDTQPDTTDEQPDIDAYKPKFTSVSLCGLTSCGVKEDGTLWCWGQYGNGVIENPVPKKVPTEKPIKSVHTGDDNVCFIDSADDAWIWFKELTPMENGSKPTMPLLWYEKD